MLAISSSIVNNQITLEDGNSYTIHIDEGYVSIGDNLFYFSLERTGVTINDKFWNFNEYTFAVQNYGFQHAGICYHISTVNIFSDLVRLEKANKIITARIVNNQLIIGNDTRPPIRRQLERPISRRTEVSSLRSIANDSQNTHDSGILNHLLDIYKTLPRSELTWHDVTYIIPKTDERINRVLQYISYQNGHHSKFGDNEKNILTTVVSFIRHDRDALELLSANLIDCIDGPNFMCLTGRVSRILNSIAHKFERKLKASECRQMLLGQASKLKFESNEDVANVLIQNNPNVTGILDEVISWNLA